MTKSVSQRQRIKKLGDGEYSSGVLRLQDQRTTEAVWWAHSGPHLFPSLLSLFGG